MLKRVKDFLPQVKDYYTINSLGEVFSDNIQGRQLKFRKGKHGYLRVMLSHIDGTQKEYSVHRLVLMAFSPNDNFENLQVNHIDANKENNNLSNLEWVACSENQKHAVRLGLSKAAYQRGEENHACKLSDKDVVEIFRLRAEGLTHQKIADIFQASRRHIGNILQGKRRNKNQV